MAKFARQADKAMQGEARRRRSAKDAGFDRWLGKQLHAMYDPVLDEELPESLLELLNGFEPGSAGNPGAKDDGKEPK
ncbi:MAG: NepR family anti-sigma factor [Geminicoccaceae bacterium]